MTLLLISGIIFAIYMFKVNSYQTTVANFSYTEIDFSDTADGTYTGECDVDFIYARVAVEIKSGQIADIQLLKHRNDRGAKADVIVDSIVTEQQIDIDTIAGATNSCKVIKKAVEKALTD